jgi:hypothetical protein
MAISDGLKDILFICRNNVLDGRSHVAEWLSDTLSS